MRLFKKHTPLPDIKAVSEADIWRELYENGGKLKLASSVSKEIARLVTLEMKGRIAGSKRAEELNMPFSELIKKAKGFTEIAAALGGVMLKPYVKNGKICTAILPQDSFSVTKTGTDGELKAVKFFERAEKNGKKYIKCEHHIMLDSGYIIANSAYLDTGMFEREVPLSEIPEWEDIEKEVYLKNVYSPLFAYFGMPFKSPKNINSPLGASVYSRAVELIDDANRQYERLLWEFESGERALYVDETSVRKDSLGNPVFPNKKLYRMLNTGKDELFEDWTPEIRDKAIINGLDKILRRIEFNTGLAYGTLSDIETVEKTAEEIRASKQRSYATVTEIQESLKKALSEWVRAADILSDLYELSPEGKIDTSFEFDDSIIADRNREFEERMSLLEKGVITADEMRKWYLGEGGKI
ncbi:MAG: phage portal protein [Clostridia bacterium]|nr:phage portal protein [Clostridia bacterium]